METIETKKTDNELIAEFMGWKQSDGNDGVFHKGVWYDQNFDHYDALKFDTSWDWLMPVVEKIDKLYREDFPPGEEFVRRILQKEDPIDRHYIDVIALPLSTSIKEAHKAVVEFIKWHNAQVK